MGRSESRVDNPRVRLVFHPLLSPRIRGRSALPALVAGAVAVLLALPGARASDHNDHERVRAAVQAGEVLALPLLLERLQRTHPGRVLELELERDDGRWIYEVKLLKAGGQLLKLEVDAGTGQVLDAKRRRPDKPRVADDAPSCPGIRVSRPHETAAR